jgi:hypothetical protein
MKRLRIFLFCPLALISSCEEETCKQEWSILQKKGDAFIKKEKKLIIIQEDSYNIMGVFDDLGKPVWILLNPKVSPWYKQIPASSSFSLSKDNFLYISDRKVASETVLQVLKSRVN